jgi:peptide/nickel transport system substrate-binding protein
MSLLGRVVVAAVVVVAIVSIGRPARAQTTLRVVMHSDLKIVDPIWTTANITRDHGYMIYDTLFAMDGNGEIKPQMVDTYEVSADKLTHTFTLREGLAWHDGRPVTAEDCVASIDRWRKKDVLGQTLFSYVAGLEARDAKTIVMRLKESTGLVLTALGKPTSNVPFMMPKRVAETDPGTQISDFTGSGPFIFKRDEWNPGDKVVYVRNQSYKPRAEAPSGLAGGKVAKVDRIEWRAISDPQQAVNALLAGEIDMIELPPHDLYPLLRASKDVKLFAGDQLGSQYIFRPNWTARPFDNPKVRQALWYAFNQQDFLRAAIGDPDFYRVCLSYFICGTPLAAGQGMDGLLKSDFRKAQALLKEAGYDGTPIVLLHSTDIQVLANLAPVAKHLMQKAGFTVDMQSMSWQTLVARREKKDGWHALLTAAPAAEVLNPLTAAFFNTVCDKAVFGWACDAEMEVLRDRFARESDPERQKAIADAVQVRGTQTTTHIPLGQWYRSSALRRKVQGALKAPATVFWNIVIEQHTAE